MLTFVVGARLIVVFVAIAVLLTALGSVGAYFAVNDRITALEHDLAARRKIRDHETRQFQGEIDRQRKEVTQQRGALCALIDRIPPGDRRVDDDRKAYDCGPYQLPQPGARAGTPAPPSGGRSADSAPGGGVLRPGPVRARPATPPRAPTPTRSPAASRPPQPSSPQPAPPQPSRPPENDDHLLCVLVICVH